MIDRLPVMRLVLAVCTLLVCAVTARAEDVVEIGPGQAVVDLLPAVQRADGAGLRFTFRAAPDETGIVRRIEVRSQNASGANAARGTGDWITFSLANTTDQPIDRLLVAPHYRMVGSGLWSPDLGARRLASVTPSAGFALEAVPDRDADVFRITLEPGAVVTFAAELASAGLPVLRLWEPDARLRSVNAFTLYRGIIIGISGLLAVFLTVLFVVKGEPMFPGAALLAWAVLGYVALDFGFVDAFVRISPADEGFWRAALEVAIATALIVFVFAYLSLHRWHLRFWWIFVPWLAGLVTLAIVARSDPALAAGIARGSLAITGGVGVVLIIALALRRYDRAVLLVPAWLLLLVWLAGAWAVVTGRLASEIAHPAIVGGLVLIVMLLAFTVVQHAFAGGPLGSGIVSDVERQALAISGTGDAVFDWDIGRDRIVVDPGLAVSLGMPPGTLDSAPRDWTPHLHPEDRERFHTALDVLVQTRAGQLSEDVRLRGQRGAYHWFRLRARPVVGSDGEVLRCVGTLSDVTAQRVTEERLLRDAVHDNLTGLPNRSLFMDRLSNALTSRHGVAVLLVDVDRFAQLNDAMGLGVGDAMLLTMARRLQRIASPSGTLARLSGDRFALLLPDETDPDKLAATSERIRRSVANPVTFAGEELIATASIGIATARAGAQTDAKALLSDAELALVEAKRHGGDSVVPFRDALRDTSARDYHLETDLRRAIERNEIELHFQPIVALVDGAIVGFEALIRWNSGSRGIVGPDEFIPMAERTGLIVTLGNHVLDRAAATLAQWNAKAKAPVFVSVNVSSRQLLGQDLVQEIKSVIARHDIGAGLLKLEITESLLMDEPEQATALLERIRDAGAGLSLDDFGTGYSSLAQLTTLPFETMKLDRSLVQRTSDDVLAALVALGRGLGLRVVAEGIETERDAERLRRAGADFGQGYLYGKPIDETQAKRLLARGTKPVKAKVEA